MKIETLVKRNMPLPVVAKKSFFTTRPNQERIVLDFVQYTSLEEKVVNIAHGGISQECAGGGKQSCGHARAGSVKPA
jgi:hypothetical protein